MVFGYLKQLLLWKFGVAAQGEFQVQDPEQPLERAALEKRAAYSKV